MRSFRPSRSLVHLLRTQPRAALTVVRSLEPFTLSRSAFAPLSSLFEPRSRHEDSSEPASANQEASASASSASSADSRYHHRKHLERSRRAALSPFFGGRSLFNDPFFAEALNPFSPSLFSPLATIPEATVAHLEMDVNLFSTPRVYTIEASLPGVSKEDIKLTIKDGMLRIEAERKSERRSSQPTHKEAATIPELDASMDATSASTSTTTAVQNESTNAASTAKIVDEPVEYHVVESSYGRVSRTIALPEDIDADKLVAKHQNGLLTIELPRLQVEQNNERNIAVQ